MCRPEGSGKQRNGVHHTIGWGISTSTLLSLWEWSASGSGMMVLPFLTQILKTVLSKLVIPPVMNKPAQNTLG